MTKLNLPTIKWSDIKDEVTVCPYCMNDASYDSFGCCGESSDHFEKAWVTNDDECYLDSQVYISYTIWDRLTIWFYSMRFKYWRLERKLVSIFK